MDKNDLRSDEQRFWSPERKDHSAAAAKKKILFSVGRARGDAGSRGLDPHVARMLRSVPCPAPMQWHKKLVVVLVGLPARGKSYIAHKIVSFLRWRGLKADLFNVGKARRTEITDEPQVRNRFCELCVRLACIRGFRHRAVLIVLACLGSVLVSQDAKFFAADNKEAKAKRENLAFAVLDDLLNWLGTSLVCTSSPASANGVPRTRFSRSRLVVPRAEQGGDVAVFDATNTTRDRRIQVLQRCTARAQTLPVLFIESICDDERVLESNLRVKASNSPDYRHMKLEDVSAGACAWRGVPELLASRNLTPVRLLRCGDPRRRWRTCGNGSPSTRRCTSRSTTTT
jgi:hypothetical protein